MSYGRKLWYSDVEYRSAEVLPNARFSWKPNQDDVMPGIVYTTAGIVVVKISRPIASGYGITINFSMMYGGRLWWGHSVGPESEKATPRRVTTRARMFAKLVLKKFRHLGMTALERS